MNSGSSANLLSGNSKNYASGGGEVIVPPLTWVSDIVALIHTGFTPIFADIDPSTLAMDPSEIMKKSTITLAQFSSLIFKASMG